MSARQQLKSPVILLLTLLIESSAECKYRTFQNNPHPNKKSTTATLSLDITEISREF